MTALSRSASAKTMKGDLPPSSSEVEARVSAELRTTARPAMTARMSEKTASVLERNQPAIQV